MTTSTATETARSSKEVDALDVFTFSGLSDEEITDLGVAPFSAPVHPTSPTPSIKFYNWDFYIQINHQSITQTTSLYTGSTKCVWSTLHMDNRKQILWSVMISGNHFLDQIHYAAGICCVRKLYSDFLFGYIQDTLKCGCSPPVLWRNVSALNTCMF